MRLDGSLVVQVAPEVFRPAEDTFLLLDALDLRPGERFLEVGAGTGMLAMHAARIAGSTVATDVSPHAVRCIRENARRNGLRIEVVRCDLLRGIRGTFDVIAFNPPYLAERMSATWAERAWQGGARGDDVIVRFLEELPESLAVHGRCLLTVPANRSRTLSRAREAFVVRVVREVALFFEKLLAVELTVRRQDLDD